MGMSRVWYWIAAVELAILPILCMAVIGGWIVGVVELAPGDSPWLHAAFFFELSALSVFCVYALLRWNVSLTELRTEDGEPHGYVVPGHVPQYMFRRVMRRHFAEQGVTDHLDTCLEQCEWPAEYVWGYYDYDLKTGFRPFVLSKKGGYSWCGTADRYTHLALP